MFQIHAQNSLISSQVISERVKLKLPSDHPSNQAKSSQFLSNPAIM